MATEWERAEMDVERRESELAEDEGFNGLDGYDDCSHDYDYEFDDPEEAEQFSNAVRMYMQRGYTSSEAKRIALRRGY